MPTSKEFINSFNAAACNTDGVSYRAMMGEYVLYYRGKVVGGFYDNRLLVKPVEGLEKILPNSVLQIPYAGARPMVWLENFDGEILTEVFEFLYKKLPEPKPKKKRRNV